MKYTKEQIRWMAKQITQYLADRAILASDVYEILYEDDPDQDIKDRANTYDVMEEALTDILTTEEVI